MIDESLMLDVNGIRIHTTTTGQGPAVLLLHGFPDTHIVWRKQVPVLAAAGFRVLAPDLRGYGRSDAPGGVFDYTMDKLRGDMLGLLDALHIDNVFLVGHDWGGIIGWQIAALAPERVHRYVAMSTGHPYAIARPGILQRLRMTYILGFIMPGIQFKDNLNLRPNTYQILVKQNVVAQGELLVGYMLAIQTANTDTSEELVGFPTTEPAFGKPAVWVAGAEAQRASQLGYMVQDPTNVLIAHLDEVVRAHSSEILSREEVQIMLNKIRERAPTTVKELVPDKMELGEVQRVLQKLLKERVSIRDMATILEKLSDFSKLVKDPEVLTELVRATMARQICASLADENGIIYAITLDQSVEMAIKNGIVPGPMGQQLALNQQIRGMIVERVSNAYQNASAQGYVPAVLCDPVAVMTFCSGT